METLYPLTGWVIDTLPSNNLSWVLSEPGI